MQVVEFLMFIKSPCYAIQIQKEGDFFVIETNDWVNVLAITSDKEIILVRQFRYGTEKYSLEPRRSC